MLRGSDRVTDSDSVSCVILSTEHADFQPISNVLLGGKTEREDVDDKMRCCLRTLPFAIDKMPSNSHYDQNSKKIPDQTNNFSEKTCSRAECKMERRRRGKTNKSKLSGPFISADLVRRMQTMAEGKRTDKDNIPVKMKFTQPRSRNHSSAPRSNGQWRERTGVEISTFYGTGRRERASTGKLVSPSRFRAFLTSGGRGKSNQGGDRHADRLERAWY